MDCIVRYFNTLIKNFKSRIKKKIPKMIFAVGDSSKLIRNGDATKNEDVINSKIIQSVFGLENHNYYSELKNNFGIGRNGFNITSCQFAIHYFFKDKLSLANFISNIIDCTKDNGYFVCTSYDGKRIFDLLKDKLEESRYIEKDNTKVNVWKVIKKYDKSVFRDDITSLGYSIDVYQESINTLQTEFLVNYDYFIGLMNYFGFNHISDTTLDSFENIYKDYEENFL